MGNRMDLFLRLVNTYFLLLWQHGMGILGCWRYIFPNRDIAWVLSLVSLGANMDFEDFWKAWPKSIRKGGKSTCKAKWDKLKLDLQADQIVKHVIWMKTTDAWTKSDGSFIPAPLVYINQQRWDGAEIPEMTVNVNVNFVDPAIEKINRDRETAIPMPMDVKKRLEELRRSIQVH